MSAPDPAGVLAALKAAPSAEAFFDLLAVDYDPKVLAVSRLHVLKRMADRLDGADLDALPPDVAVARCRDTLARAYAEFVGATPLDVRAFAVLKRAAAPAPSRFVPFSTLLD